MGVRSTGSHPTTTKADGHLIDYFRQNFSAGGGGETYIAPLSGLTATGGVISDYTDGPVIYRAHVFTASGTFDVSALGTEYPANVEYLVVAGGGGGGSHVGGGGGAGGLLSNHPDVPSPKRQAAFPVSTSPGAYAVVVGGGGQGISSPGQSPPQTGNQGGPSSFGPVSTTGGGGGGAGFLKVELEDLLVVLDMDLDLP